MGIKELKIKGSINQTQWQQLISELTPVLTKFGVELLSEDLSNKILVAIEWKAHRGFDGLKEEFICRTETWDELFNIHLKDKEIYFGEIAGKHSEIYGNLAASDVNVCSHEPTMRLFFDTYGNYKRPAHSFLTTHLNSLLDTGVDATRFKKLISEIIP